MLKYLQKVFDRLSAIKSGIHRNAASWSTTPHDASEVQTYMNALTTINNDLDALQKQVKQKQQAARKLAAAMSIKAEKIEKVAIGIHAESPEKLVEYNIAVAGSRQSRPIPGKAVIAYIADDDDNMGFKIKVQKLPDVDFYEWEKGSIGGNDITVTVLQTPYPFWRGGRKKLMVDNDIQPGVRYFYRVRGINAAGAGAWSEPVNRVQ